MKTIVLLPTINISNQMSSILIIENFEKVNDFIGPLYANGTRQPGAVKQDQIIGNLL